MGLDYNIIISTGFLIKKCADIPDWFYEELSDIHSDGMFVGLPSNIFLDIKNTKTYYCGGYDEKWGIPNFIGDCYDENELSKYADEIQKLFSKTKEAMQFQFCRCPKSNLQEESYVLSFLGDEEKEKEINNMLKYVSSSKKKQFVQEVLEDASYGVIMMKYYS